MRIKRVIQKGEAKRKNKQNKCPGQRSLDKIVLRVFYIQSKIFH